MIFVAKKQLYKQLHFFHVIKSLNRLYVCFKWLSGEKERREGGRKTIADPVLGLTEFTRH